jgi:hypothetical protein
MSPSGFWHENVSCCTDLECSCDEAEVAKRLHFSRFQTRHRHCNPRHNIKEWHSRQRPPTHWSWAFGCHCQQCYECYDILPETASGGLDASYHPRGASLQVWGRGTGAGTEHHATLR